jgi:hypothetical protein
MKADKTTVLTRFISPAILPHRALALPVTRCTIPLSALEGVRGAGNRTAGAVFLHYPAPRFAA